MKKIFLSLIALVLFANSFAQDYKKSPTIGVHLILNDFKSAAQIRANGLSDLLNSKQFKNTNRMVAGIGFSYIQGLSSHVDFAGTLSGSYVNYPVPNVTSDGQQNLLLEAVGTANLKLLTDKYCVVPFLTAGIGASKYKGYYGGIIPLGVGLQIKILDETTLLVNSQYRIPVTTNTAAYHFYHSFGVAMTFKKKAMTPAADVSLTSGN